MTSQRVTRNLLVEIAYQGQCYHGYQVQKNALSVAEVLQNAIESVLGVREPIIGCSRTDTGVHAHKYYFNMHTQNQIPVKRFVNAMNNVLPGDIVVFRCVTVPVTFHARHDCNKKEYLYRIWQGSQRNPFLHNMVFHYPHALEIDRLQYAAQQFVGHHDFRAFCGAGSKNIQDTARTVYECEVFRYSEQEVRFRVSGNGFLYHMVRIMVGTLLDVQEGRIAYDEIVRIIQSKDRTQAGRTIAPQGLYLDGVEYGRDWFEQTSKG